MCAKYCLALMSLTSGIVFLRVNVILNRPSQKNQFQLIKTCLMLMF